MKPIIFTTELIPKILDGSKTQTRRVIKPQPTAYPDRMFDWAKLNHLVHISMLTTKCPYGQVGDRLWVRETWATYQANDDWKPSEIPQGATIFRESEIGEYGYIGKRRSPLFMPRWASRITLEITGIRVERLQEIGTKDIKAEGISLDKNLIKKAFTRQDLGNMLLGRFSYLWDSLNAKRGYPWESNPWVWVIEFKKL